jgi:uncharacterized protein YceK
MKKMVIILAVLALFLAGCASQKSSDIVCNAPYIRHAAGCCIDKDANSVCDTDEREEPLFVEPDYLPSKDVPDVSAEWENEPVYIPPAEDGADSTAEEDEGVYVGEKTDVKSVSTAYVPSAVKLTGWTAENEHMSLEITKIVVDVVPVRPNDLRSPDKEAYLKEMYLTVKNKDYDYLNPKFFFRLGDSKDPIIIQETLLCDRSDDIVMEGCSHALPETETMYIRMPIDRQLPRLELYKTIRLTLQNRRDTEDKNILMIEKTNDILGIFGAEYI